MSRTFRGTQGRLPATGRSGDTGRALPGWRVRLGIPGCLCLRPVRGLGAEDLGGLVRGGCGPLAAPRGCLLGGVCGSLSSGRSVCPHLGPLSIPGRPSAAIPSLSRGVLVVAARALA